MSDQWTAFDFKRKLRAQVAARSGITSLTPTPRVISYFPSPDEPMTDLIIIGYTSVDSDEHQRAHVGGHRFDEQVDIVSQIRVVRSGAGQDVADTAETRSEELLAEVDDEVRNNLPDVGDQSWAGKVIERESSMFATQSQLVCVTEFVIQFKARTGGVS
jgi:hypothetical protein